MTVPPTQTLCWLPEGICTGVGGKLFVRWALLKNVLSSVTCQEKVCMLCMGGLKILM